MSQRYRVIQWATGKVGKQTLKGILDHPQLELAGLWVHNPDDAGIDAGEFCGYPETGIVASADAKEMLAIDADCVAYLPTCVRGRQPAEQVEADLVEDIASMLGSGKNVVGVQEAMIFPRLLGPELLGKLEQACRAGATSYFPTGINANGSQTVLATLASMCQRVESTYLCEMYNFEAYDDPKVFRSFGYGLPPEQAQARDLRPMFEYLFGHALHLTAHWFGVELDEVRWDQEVAVSERDLRLPRFSADAGTVSAIRFDLHGYVEGTRRVTQAGCYWIGDYPKHWEPPPGDGGYRIAVTGEPDMRVQWATDAHNEAFQGPLAKPRGPEELAIMGGLMGTAARAVNSIPELCRAEPGIVTLCDQSPLLPPVDWRRGGAGDQVGAVFAGARG
jgi:2,4-diaminopentanoate dehydrogenase